MRQINPSLKAVIDSNVDVTLPPAQLLIAAANSMLGVTEDSAMQTVDWIRSTVAKPWSEPWCADFVQTCIAYVEAVKGIQSQVAVSESVLDMWTKTTSHTAIPAVGDVIIWRLGQTQEGHCGIITNIDTLLYSTIEGNTSDSSLPEIDRTGRGVFAKKRAKGGTKTFTEVGFLRCFT